MNTFLNPLVEELKCLWHGQEMTVCGFTSKQLVRCALLCAACDLPAGRKLCGFLSFNARLGCTRCWKEFPGEVGDRDYSGFDRENWKPRENKDHIEYGEKLLSCTTKAEQHHLESSTGYRYTALLELPYYNSTRMLTVDPMHNLFLGTAKHYIKAVWLDQNIVNHDEFDFIQSRIDNIKLPSDIGRIPYKIGSGFSSFTADQFKSWVLYFSLLCLRDKLTGDHFECWRHFVLACRLLCSKSITIEEVKLADALLLYFCKRTERLYGKKVITPNMHCHTHLMECILDYGPIHGFWLFSYERFNGQLGHQPNNNRSIEVQLMNRFLRDNEDMSMSLPEEFQENFGPLFCNRKLAGTVSDTVNSTVLPLVPLDVENTKDWSLESGSLCVDITPHATKGTLNSAEREGLKMLYSKLYSVVKLRSTLCTSNIKH